MADKEDAAKAADTAKKDRAAEKADREKAAADQKDILKRLSDIATGQGAGSSSKLDWKDRVKARKQRDSMIKGDRSLKGDLKKNVKDIKDNFIGGIDATINEMFGPALGGIVSSFTTGMFKRGDDAKEALALQQTSNEQGEDILASFDEKIAGGAVDKKKGEPDAWGRTGKAEEAWGASDDEKDKGGAAGTSTDAVVSALGGVAEAPSSGYGDIELELWTKMEDHLFFMRSNTETAEGRRERLRNQKGKKAGGILSKVKKKKDGGIDWMDTLLTLGKFFLPAGAITTAVGMLGTGFATLGAVALPLAVVAAAMKAIYDGFIGWMSAEDWGVSKISGALGGFFGGDAEGGIMNMFINAGKWAAIGAGIGSVVPVVGTIAGGLIGAAFGAILGLIGGKKLATGFDALGKFISDAFHATFIKPFMLLLYENYWY